MVFNSLSLDRKYESITWDKLKVMGYGVCLFIYDLNSKEQVQQLESFGYNKISNLEQFIEKRSKNLFKVFYWIY